MLDLDLDFFLDGIAYYRGAEERVDEGELTPRTEADVIAFLEDRCGLSRSNPIPGRVVVNHHEAFLYWRELIQEKRLSTPFEVVHVDAHADLGGGDGGYRHLMTEVLHWDLSSRQYPEFDIGTKCGLGNYLAFAVACRWISRLVFVTHPNWKHDLLQYHFTDYDTSSGKLQLKKLSKEQVKDLPYSWVEGCIHEIVPLALEPEVPFELVPGESFVDSQGFDFVVLSQSPGFTPASADRLIPVVRDFLLEE